MNSKLGHRGPDAQGTFVEQGVGLGHVRLSIIDLRPESNQPFVSTSQRYVIVFNGEIYNYRVVRSELEAHGISFRTHSDTEVIVEAFAFWGKQMIQRLYGMFAICILDRETGNLHFFRDRVGKKPLFYYQSDSLFAFASEIKALMAVPAIAAEKKIRYDQVASFLHLGYIPEPNTIFENIYKFPSGHYGEVRRDGTFYSEPYWTIADQATSQKIDTMPEAGDRLLTVLRDATRDRLVSDVPVGAFLSGGTDSSLVTALVAKELDNPIKTFSIGFKDVKNDESVYASAVARHLGVQHTAYQVEEREALEILEKYIHHFDEPFADTSAIPTMIVSRLARKEVTVALTGDGGDELFLGYGAHTWAQRLNSLPWKVAHRPMSMVFKEFGNSRFKRVGELLSYTGTTHLPSHIFSQEQCYFSWKEIHSSLLRDASLAIAPEFHDTVAGKSYTPAERQAIFDLDYYLKNDLLVKVDRASMYYALECRCPLLDHRVVELAMAMDYRLKRNEGQSKWILKQLLRKYLPDDRIYRPKKGFSIPLRKWLRGELSSLLSYLDQDITESVGLFHYSYLRKLKDNFMRGDDYLYHRLWLIISLHKWMKDNA